MTLCAAIRCAQTNGVQPKRGGSTTTPDATRIEDQELAAPSKTEKVLVIRVKSRREKHLERLRQETGNEEV